MRTLNLSIPLWDMTSDECMVGVQSAQLRHAHARVLTNSLFFLTHLKSHRESVVAERAPVIHMLVALRYGIRVVASRDLSPGGFFCPVCGLAVTLKPGRTVVPHFAHRSDTDCPAGKEGLAHEAAKLTLLTEMTALGYRVELEKVYPGRRVDVAVSGRSGRIAVECQDSPISVDAIRARNRVDRRLGFDATLWIWVGGRAARLAQAELGEARIPDEMRWLADRYRAGLFAMDPAGEVRRYWLARVTRGGDDEWGRIYTPKTIRSARSTVCDFALDLAETRFRPQSRVERTAEFRALPGQVTLREGHAA